MALVIDETEGPPAPPTKKTPILNTSCLLNIQNTPTRQAKVCHLQSSNFGVDRVSHSDTAVYYNGERKGIWCFIFLKYTYMYFLRSVKQRGMVFFSSGSTHIILSIGTKSREGGTILTVFFFLSGRKKKPSQNPRNSSNSHESPIFTLSWPNLQIWVYLRFFELF